MKRIRSLFLLILLGPFAYAQDSGALGFRAPEAPPVRLDRYSLPPVYDYSHLGIFCKLDVQLERRLPLPVRFRLGDPMLVDTWEGKGPLRRR